jgi:hypothetical protein
MSRMGAPGVSRSRRRIAHTVDSESKPAASERDLPPTATTGTPSMTLPARAAETASAWSTVVAAPRWECERWVVSV